MTTDSKSLATSATSIQNASMKSDQLPYARMIRNFLLVWLDGNIDEVNSDDSRKTIAELRQVVDSVNTFTDIDKCIDFITDVKDEKFVFIVSGSFSKFIVPLVQEISHVTSVYIYSNDEVQYEKWTKNWAKVKGVFTDIKLICETFRKFPRKWEQDSVSISFFNPTDDVSTKNLDQLEQSFMYTQILKEILLTIDFQPVHFDGFLRYWREKYASNPVELKKIDQFEREYHHHAPIWWYTREYFLYFTLNKALRTMEVDLIIKLGFFLRDMHQNITTLHSKQYNMKLKSGSIIVYRGQGLSQTDFDRLRKGGLMSFNNFLSTSVDQDVSFVLAESNGASSDQIGVLFRITVNLTISSVPFANIRDLSAFETEEEILFTMHSIFRIGVVEQINGNTKLWKVELTLTDDTDPQLHALTERMREEIQGRTGWYRLGALMQQLGEFEKARELYETLLQQTAVEKEKGILFHHLGYIETQQGNYEQALQLYEKSLQINRKIYSSNHLDFATSYNNIGMVYNSMGEYSKALSHYQKALEIRSKSLSPYHPDLASLYHNIGMVYDRMGEYSKALSDYEKALEIEQKTLPPNHPSVAISYGNIGLVYQHKGEYSKALSYHQKALEIQQKTLPSNHPELGNPYGNIALAYHLMGEYSKALSYYEKALEIQQRSLHPNHPSLGATYQNIGAIYHQEGEYPKALLNYEKALKIHQKNLHPKHPSLATYKNQIGVVCYHMGDYSKAFSYMSI
jgi:tetratricopeptide (TPR) repeat protein